MRSFRLGWLVAVALLLASGCESVAPNAPDAGHGDMWDTLFKRRHLDVKAPVENDPMLSLAREITVLEDDIRHDGSITVKTPDVWGDAELMHYIQEYDRELTGTVTSFSQTLQAYIARSDQMELQSATGLGMAVGGVAPPVAVPTNVSIDNKGAMSSNGVLTPTPDSLSDLTPSDLIKKALDAAKSKVTEGIGVEPTELERQHSTFILVNQALRRRNTGDDGSRAAGYALYKFRIPVSILPGRDTYQGHSAIVTLRAQLHADAANLRYTFPKLVIADLVETLTPVILKEWGIKDKSQEGEAPPVAPFPDGWRKSTEFPTAVLAPKAIFGSESVYALRAAAQDHFGSVPPKPLDLRNYLFRYLGQVHSILYERGCYGNPLIANVGEQVARGFPVNTGRQEWINSIGTPKVPAAPENTEFQRFPSVSWLVAVQSGILNQNLHRILKELQLRGKLCECPEPLNDVLFFAPDEAGQTARLWSILVQETFPLHVFALDPEIEEQNVYDAFSRRREMQLALAISVASGRLNAGQKLAMSRQLALDEATVAMNRCVVGFSHGNETFGWYFFPRVQTPPTESSNIGALARMIWSTGPTECYDLKHRKLEPGMRECEVLVAMPSFVTEVSFDVTSNWECLAHPGITKRSYEEMVAQGGRLHRLRLCLQEAGNQQCYRPGDYARLLSRIDQLEQMLGMQTYTVSVPYEYEQTGTDLFDTGKDHLRPILSGYYGLEFVQGDDGTAAFVFLAGKNFHPTQTHVIVGGMESHSRVPDDCEVISRDLLRVKINKVSTKLSRPGQFEVRVATPAGLSEALVISAAPAASAVSAFDWKAAPVFAVQLTPVARPKPGTAPLQLAEDGHIYSQTALRIDNQTNPRLPIPMVKPQLCLALSVKFKSGTERTLAVTRPIDVKVNDKEELSVAPEAMLKAIDLVIQDTMDIRDDSEGTITGTAYLKIDQWPYVKLDKVVTLSFVRTKEKSGGPGDANTAYISPLPPVDAPREPLAIGLRNPKPREGQFLGTR